MQYHEYVCMHCRYFGMVATISVENNTAICARCNRRTKVRALDWRRKRNARKSAQRRRKHRKEE